MNAMTTRYTSLVLVLLLFIAAILSPSVAGPSPCSGALARQNERCRNNISFFKRMLDTGRRGGTEGTTIEDENWEQMNNLEENTEDMNDYRYKLQLILELLKDIDQYKL